MILFELLISAFLCFCALWYCFLAYTALLRVHNRKTNTIKVWRLLFKSGLSGTQLTLGSPLLVVGFALDVFCNLLISVPFFESPRWKEWTVSQRCRRWARGPNGRRKRFAVWIGSTFTDDFDPHHILPKPDLNQPAQ